VAKPAFLDKHPKVLFDEGHLRTSSLTMAIT
jgi:hypothetical protein